MFTEIQAVIASTRVLNDIISASKDLRDFNQLAAAVYEVNAKLMQAIAVALASQEKELACAERVRDLEQQIVKFENWETKSQNYTLKAVGGGYFAYVYTPLMQATKPKHWACTKCFEKGQLFTLQREYAIGYKCPNCNTEIILKSDGNAVNIEDL